MDELAALPGLGDQRAGTLVVNRPYESTDEAAATLGIDLPGFTTTRAPEGAD